MRVVLVLSEASLSGGPRHVLELARGLSKAGSQPLIVSPNGPMVELFKSENLSHIGLRPVFAFWQINQLIRLKTILTAERRSSDDLIVHVHGLRLSLVAALAARLAKVPAVYTEHLYSHDYHLKSRARELIQLLGLRLACSMFDQIIAPSKAVARFLIDRAIVAGSKINLVYEAVRLPVLRSRVEKENTGQVVRVRVEKPRPLLVSAGGLNRQKGFRYLIAALPVLIDHYPELVCLVIGQGPLGPSLIEQSKRLKIAQKNLRFLGELPETELVIWLKKADLVVIPSLAESFGLVLLMAMMLGRPALASKVGSLPELMLGGRGRKGAKILERLLIEPAKPKILASRILELISDQKMLEKASRLLKIRSADFKTEKMIGETLAVYRKAISVS